MNPSHPNRMNKIALEFLVIFVCMPFILYFDMPIVIKLGVLLLVIVYFLWLNIFRRGLIFQPSTSANSIWTAVKHDIKAAFGRADSLSNDDKTRLKNIWLRVILQFLISAKLITLFVILAYPDELFKVPTTKPSLWIGISFVYVFLSVIPQEYIYRVFFFSRYQGLFTKPWAMIIASTICFCMVHLMFNNSLVMLLTLIGGLLFSITYYQSKNYTMCVIEHSLYGLWLFTVGLGDMLAFPS